jgi:hypothetical protein
LRIGDWFISFGQRVIFRRVARSGRGDKCSSRSSNCKMLKLQMLKLQMLKLQMLKLQMLKLQMVKGLDPRR